MKVLQGSVLKSTFMPKTQCISQIHFVNNIIHSDDGPAVINHKFANGKMRIWYMFWYKNDIPHRESKPASIWFNYGNINTVVIARWYRKGLLYKQLYPVKYVYKNDEKLFTDASFLSDEPWWTDTDSHLCINTTHACHANNIPHIYKGNTTWSDYNYWWNLDERVKRMDYAYHKNQLNREKRMKKK